LTADPSSSAPQDPSSSTSAVTQEQPAAEAAADIASDPFSSYFSSTDDPTIPPKVLITTSPKATRATYEFCDELVGLFPGAEFHRRPKTRGFEMGKIAGWAAGRGFTNLLVVNENVKKPSAYFCVCLAAPAAYNRLRRCDNFGTLT
jgi:ribosome production factor 1